MVREQQKDFDRLKVIMAKKAVVKIFDLQKDITLTIDASKHSISVTLSQEGHPIIYLSRRLTNTEFDYSNIKKEALAIVWTTTRAWQFVIGKKFLLRSDHRPLEFIFNPSPSALMGRQIRAPLTMSYSTNEKVWYKKNKESNPERAEFIMQTGHNTAIINRE